MLMESSMYSGGTNHDLSSIMLPQIQMRNLPRRDMQVGTTSVIDKKNRSQYQSYQGIKVFNLNVKNNLLGARKEKSATRNEPDFASTKGTWKHAAARHRLPNQRYDAKKEMEATKERKRTEALKKFATKALLLKKHESTRKST